MAPGHYHRGRQNDLAMAAGHWGFYSAVDQLDEKQVGMTSCYHTQANKIGRRCRENTGDTINRVMTDTVTETLVSAS